MTETNGLKRLMLFVLSFFSLTLVVYILAIGSGFFIPLAIALVISYLLIAIAEGILKISYKKLKIPRFLAYIVSFSLFAVGFYIIFFILQNNVARLIQSSTSYQDKLNALTLKFSYLSDFNYVDLTKYLGQLDFSTLIKTIIITLTDIAGHTGIIFIYVIFIMIEYSFFDKKLHAFFAHKEHRSLARSILSKINSQILSYLRIKTAFSLATAISSYIVLRSVGVDFADFWAMLIFLFNYIPTIGSIVATILPCMLALLQFESLIPFLIVLICLSAIQFIFGNIVEPKVMGKKFNLSGLVIVLSLTIWGKIWGVIGMFLCMPFLVILNIILSNFPKTRPVVVLLSRDGKVENPNHL